MNTSCAYRRPVERPVYMGWQCVERSASDSYRHEDSIKRAAAEAKRSRSRRYAFQKLACTFAVVIAVAAFMAAFMWIGLDMHLPASENVTVMSEEECPDYLVSSEDAVLNIDKLEK